MAMNKKEQQALEDALRAAELNRALRWSDLPVPQPDMEPPKTFRDLACGWSYYPVYVTNGVIHRVGKHCSSSISQGMDWIKTSSQNPRRLYSKRIDALRALRASAEKEFAKQLADLDREIAKELEDPSPEGFYKKDE